jgi:hypothetical protein
MVSASPSLIAEIAVPAQPVDATPSHRNDFSKSLFTIFSVRAVIQMDICRGKAEAIAMEDEAEKAVSE